MKALTVLLFTALICIGSTRAEAGLVITVAEIGSNVRLDYSGTLNLAGIGSSTSASIAERNIRQLSNANFYRVYISNLPTLPNGRLRNYFDPFSTMPPDYLSTTGTPAISSFGGTSLRLTTFIGTLPAGLNGLSVDTNDVVADVWTGSGFLQWNNTTIATLGIDPSPKLWVLNNATADSITMTVTVVPEPSTMLLVGLASVGGLVWNRRRVGRHS